jgi:branched-chain amino acid transport system permease protein
MNYLLHQLIFFDIYLIVALSLNIVVGYCGLLTLAHASYFAIGAYAYALATLALGWGFAEAALLGIGIAAAASLLLSLSAWRLRGDFFVLITLAVQAVIFSGLYNWWTPGTPYGHWKNLTNGPVGLSGIAKPSLFGAEIAEIASIAILFSVLAIVFGLLTYVLLSSPWGRLMKALRDDELAARSLGKNARRAKVQAMMIACGMAGAAGAMYASYTSYVEPGLASTAESIVLLSMIIVGGAGNSFRGPFVGTLVLLVIPEALRFLDLPDVLAVELRLLIYGMLLLFLMHWRPQGLAGNYKLE